MKEVHQDLLDLEDDQDPSGSKQNFCKKNWEECLHLIEKEIPWQTFKTWFTPIIPVSFVDGTLILRVPSHFVFEWLESHFSVTLNNSIKSIFGKEARVEYLIAPSVEDKRGKLDQDNLVKEGGSDKDPSKETASPDFIESRLKPLFTFGNFFISRINRVVKKAAEYVASHLDGDRFNPLFYYGDVGTGKTHLLNAIGNGVSDLYPGKKVIYLNGERFLHEYVSALEDGKINNFKEMLADSDLFLFDDVQYLSNKMKSQENLAYVISQLLEKNKRVVITSNVPPARLPRFNQRLISTFQSGLIVDLSIPEHRIRERIIQHHLIQNGVKLSVDIVEYLGEKFDSNLHILNAALVRIIAQVSLLGSSINLDECRKITSHLCSELKISNGSIVNLSKITVDKVIRNVSAFFDVPPDLIVGNSRITKIVLARQIAMYISRKYIGESFASIGYHFGNRNHSTVLYACNKIQKKLGDNPELQNGVEQIVAGILA